MWKLTVDPLYIDCWPTLHCWLSLHWLLILSTLTVDPLYTIDSLYIEWWSSLHCWPSLHWLLTLSTLYIDCPSSLHWLLTLSTLTVDPLHSLSICPPPKQRQLPFHAKVKVECWSSPHQLLIAPPRIRCWLPLWCWLLILPGSSVINPSPTFLIFNISRASSIPIFSYFLGIFLFFPIFQRKFLIFPIFLSIYNFLQ